MVSAAAQHNTSLTSTEVLKLFPGLTPRQLQWWDEQRIIVPARKNAPGGTGWIRIYNPRLTEMIGIIHKLREKGISLRRLRGSLMELERMKQFTPWLIVFPSGAVQPALNEREIAQRLAKSREWGAVIDIGQIRQTIREHAWK